MNEENSRRRTFIHALLSVGLLAAVSGLIRRKYIDYSTAVDLGSSESFVPNSVTPIDQYAIHLVRRSDGGFLALSQRCTHMGCAVAWVPDKGVFVCPCHLSEFDRRGSLLAPPASRALDLHRLSIRDSRLMLHSGEPDRRGSFSDAQVFYP